MFDFIPAQYYSLIYLLITTLFSLRAYINWQKKTCNGILFGKNTNWPILLLFCALFVWIIGNRPIIAAFGDTYFYAHSFGLAKGGILAIPESQHGDWLFNLLMVFCAQTMDYHGFFVVVEAGYIFFALWGIARIFRNNTYGAMLFFFGAFSFFTYGVNGIRNGLATSIVILAISFLLEDKPIGKIIGLFWCFVAISIHKSAILPCACTILAIFVKNPKYSFGFWLASIILYLVAGNIIGDFFASLGFDDRMSNYMENTEEYSERFKSGFRIDFLVYSAMPIWLGYEVLIKKKMQSKYFPILYNAYIYANAFWVMVMGVAYSNRFAYLSWFLYPLVLAYPCLKLNVWGEKQGKIAASIMGTHLGFTLFMEFIYY